MEEISNAAIVESVLIDIVILSDLFVILSDLFVILSDLFVILSDLFVILSDLFVILSVLFVILSVLFVILSEAKDLLLEVSMAFNRLENLITNHANLDESLRAHSKLPPPADHVAL